MLRIRKEQMDLLGAHMMRKYEQRVLRKIAQAYPARYRQDGDEKTLRFVQAGIRKAEQFGISEDNDAERFILILAEHGMDFEQVPHRSRCRLILANNKMSGHTKAVLLSRELDSECKREAAT
jgi:hypothetical protein